MVQSTNGYGKGTFIESRIFLSPAFMSLNERCQKSAQVLILFLGKRRFGKVKVKGTKTVKRSDDNRLTLTYAEAANRGISRGQFARAVDELLAKGFISIAHRGGAFEKDKTQYSLVDDYLRWRPGDAPIRMRSKDAKKGFQGAALGALKQLSHARMEPPTHARMEPPPPIDTRTHGTTPPKGKKREKPYGKAV
jgi:hypothetical protein